MVDLLTTVQHTPAPAEYENCMIDELVDAQFQLSFDLADELGVARPKTLSLRDVPGTTRSLIPLLRRNNITALTVGVNGGSPAPAMPNPGIWRDPASGASVLFMQTGQGIGYPNNPGTPTDPGGMGVSSCVTWPSITHVLCWAFRTDNSGPPLDTTEVFHQFDIARWQFPGMCEIMWIGILLFPGANIYYQITSFSMCRCKCICEHVR